MHFGFGKQDGDDANTDDSNAAINFNTAEEDSEKTNAEPEDAMAKFFASASLNNENNHVKSEEPEIEASAGGLVEENPEYREQEAVEYEQTQDDSEQNIENSIEELDLDSKTDPELEEIEAEEEIHEEIANQEDRENRIENNTDNSAFESEENNTDNSASKSSEKNAELINFNSSQEEQVPIPSNQSITTDLQQPSSNPQGPTIDPDILKEQQMREGTFSAGISIKSDESLDEKGDLEVDSETGEPMIHLEDILDAAIDYKASDIHFSAGEQIALRIDGDIHFVHNLPPLSDKQAENIAFALAQTEDMRETLLRTRELDTSYESASGVSFRVNLFYKRKNISGVLRVIASKAWTMDDLGLPAGVMRMINAKQGLVLVTGPTGSGKSTSMQSMLEYINQNRVEHILTIEDPIEFVFKSKKSIFSQREVGVDTLSFANALRASLREDPDVVMIGEMRDPETIMAAMNLSETGHLVFSTLHTSGAPQTVSRLINAFPPDQQHTVQTRLADALIGVLSQRLLPRFDTKGRVAMFELMIVNTAIKNIIRTSDMSQLNNAIQSGRDVGMIKMEKYAEMLREEGKVRKKDYEHFFMDD